MDKSDLAGKLEQLITLVGFGVVAFNYMVKNYVNKGEHQDLKEEVKEVKDVQQNNVEDIVKNKVDIENLKETVKENKENIKKIQHKLKK